MVLAKNVSLDFILKFKKKYINLHVYRFNYPTQETKQNNHI